MFAIEGVVATAYLVHLTEQFHRERSNDNARRVFKCSLWYLPLLLALFVFHRNRTLKEGDDEKLVEQLKAHLRAVCVHEAAMSPNGRAMCPMTNPVAKAAEVDVEKRGSVK